MNGRNAILPACYSTIRYTNLVIQKVISCTISAKNLKPFEQSASIRLAARLLSIKRNKFGRNPR